MTNDTSQAPVASTINSYIDAVSNWFIWTGDARDILKNIPDESVQCCVTSPPYYQLRSYNGGDAEIGQESTPAEYVSRLVAVFEEVRRVLADDGTCWINLGSSYASGGKSPSQSLLQQRVPAYGTDGKGLPGSQAAGPACCGSCDEHQAGMLSRHDRIAHSVQCVALGEPQTWLKDRDSERSDFAPTSQQPFQRDVRQSTTGAAFPNAQDVSVPSVPASASQSTPPTSQPCVQQCADNSACMCGTSQIKPPLVVHTKGKESFFSACHRSSCNGIGRCGYCFISLAITSLGVKPKDELNMPHLVAMALQADGWYLRQTIVWHKPNPIPESVTDRCTKSHEYVFLLTKKATYYYDAAAIAEPTTNEKYRTVGKIHPSRDSLEAVDPIKGRTRTGLHNQVGARETRNKRSVWTIATEPTPFAHFATMPTELVKPCILAGSREGDTVLDPFAGSGTVGVVALRHNRNFIGIELNPAYVTLAQERIVNDAPMFNMEMPA